MIRLYLDGAANLPSLRSFTAVGVLPLPDEGRVALRGDRHDRHLFATAEQDETIRHLTLASDESTHSLAIAELSKSRRS